MQTFAIMISRQETPAGNHCLLMLDLEPAFCIAIASSSALFGGMAVALTVYLKLHKKLLYRLVMYQVLAGVVYGIFFLLHPTTRNGDASALQVVGVESIILFAAGVKLLFGVCLTVHIYILAVAQRKFSKLESMYIGSSMIVPLAVTAVYFGMNYSKCTDSTMNYWNIAIICSAAAVLIGTIVGAMRILVVVVMRAVTLGGRFAVQSRFERQHKKAACEMLPLFAYHIIFLAHVLAVLCLLIWFRGEISSDKSIEVIVLESLWGLVACLTFLVHLVVVLCVQRFCKRQSLTNTAPYGSAVTIAT